MNTSNNAVASLMPWQSIYAVLSVALIAMAIGATLRHRADTFGPSDPLASLDGTRRHRLSWFWALLSTGGTLCVAAANLGPAPTVFAAIGLACGAVGFAWLYLAWGCFYRRISLHDATLYLFGGGIVSALCKLLFAFAPAGAGAALAVALPCLSLYCCTQACRTCSSEPDPTRELFPSPILPSLWKVAVLFVVFSVANAALLALQEPSATPLGTFVLERLIELALCAAVLVYAIALKRPFDFVVLWRIVLLILCTDFLLDILMPESGLQPLFAGVSLNFIVLFVWLVLADVSHHTTVAAPLVFGIGWSFYALPFFAGSLIIGTGGFNAHSTGLFAILLYAIAVFAAFCLEARDQNVSLLFDDIQPKKAAEPEDFSSIDERCRAIASDRQLTTRELEVMQMLAKGRSKAYIAETLFVTENTVKGHAKRLYAKLDVHSKKELQQLIDAY